MLLLWTAAAECEGSGIMGRSMARSSHGAAAACRQVRSATHGVDIEVGGVLVALGHEAAQRQGNAMRCTRSAAAQRQGRRHVWHGLYCQSWQGPGSTCSGIAGQRAEN